MGRRGSLVLLAMLAAIVACGEAIGPYGGGEGGPPEELAMLASVAGDDGSSLEPHILEQAESTPALETYTASFWVSRRRGGSVIIDYSDGVFLPVEDRRGNRPGAEDRVGDKTFLSLYVPRGAVHRLPNGKRLSGRDSVEISVTIDPNRLLVTLEPSGLTFRRKRPARLYLSYGAANGDYDRDGDVDDDDTLVEQYFLGMWVRELPGDPWYPVVADHSTTQRTLVGYLRHFSDHAVSW